MNKEVKDRSYYFSPDEEFRKFTLALVKASHQFVNDYGASGPLQFAFERGAEWAFWLERLNRPTPTVGPPLAEQEDPASCCGGQKVPSNPKNGSMYMCARCGGLAPSNMKLCSNCIQEKRNNVPPLNNATPPVKSCKNCASATIDGMSDDRTDWDNRCNHCMRSFYDAWQPIGYGKGM